VAVSEPAKTSDQPQGRPDGPGRRAGQLPSGRHGLLRSYVAANQRQRIIAAVAPAAAELGYAEMSVEAIIVRAGVSRRTFYEHFKNKEDAFLAAYDTAVQRAVTRVRHAYQGQATALDRLRAGIAAYLHLLASDPDAARMGIVEVLAAGPRAIARRADTLHLFAAIIEDNIRELVPSCRNPALTAQTMVGGIHEAIISRILTGHTHELPDLADHLLTAILMLDVSPGELSRDTQPPRPADGAAHTEPPVQPSPWS
jgi:AcrR family transcriptional regulator